MRNLFEYMFRGISQLGRGKLVAQFQTLSSENGYCAGSNGELTSCAQQRATSLPLSSPNDTHHMAETETER